MNVGNASVQDIFNERTVAAIVTFADNEHFAAHGNIFTHLLITVLDNAGARRFQPAAKAADARTDIVIFRDDNVIIRDPGNYSAQGSFGYIMYNQFQFLILPQLHSSCSSFCVCCHQWQHNVFVVFTSLCPRTSATR